MARSISPASCVSIVRNSTPSDGATAWITANWLGPDAMADSRRTAARVTRGAISLSSSSHFAAMLYSHTKKPVAFAARPCQAIDVARADRIGDACEYDRHSAGRLQQWCDRGAGICQDDVRRERDQFRRVFANSVGIGDAPAGVDADVAAVEPAQLREPLQERRYARLKLRVVSGAGHQDAEASHPLALLRMRRERPHRRAAE